MKNMPNVGFVCAGETALELSSAICCAGKLIGIMKDAGYSTGGCYSCLHPYAQRENLRDKLRCLSDINDVVITIGCEGYRSCDVIPELTESVCCRSAPFFTCCLSAGALRTDKSEREACADGDFTAFSSRAFAGFCGSCLIMNFSDDAIIASKRLKALLPSVNFAVGKASGNNKGAVKQSLDSLVDCFLHRKCEQNR